MTRKPENHWTKSTVWWSNQRPRPQCLAGCSTLPLTPPPPLGRSTVWRVRLTISVRFHVGLYHYCCGGSVCEWTGNSEAAVGCPGQT